MIYYVSIITLTWWDRCIKRWHFSTGTLYQQHSQSSVTFVTFTHPERVLILGSGWRILPCTMFRGPSAGPGRSVVSANNLDREVKRHRKFEKRPGSFGRVFNTWERVFVRYDIDDLLCIHYHLDVVRQLHQEMTIFDGHLVSATLPKFRHFHHLHSSWKGSDSGIRMQGYCLVQCSGVHQQVLADQWSVRTNWIARWKGMEILKRGQDLSEESSKAGKGYLWVMISTFSWWIDDLLCIHHHLDVARQLHQEMAIFDEYLASSKVRMCNTPKFPWLSSSSLILKGFWYWDRDARILPCTMSSTMLRGPSAGQCKQSGSRGEKAWKFWKEARIFRKSLQHLGKGICEIWYRWSIMYPSSPWRGETAASRDDNFRRVPCISNTPKVPSLSSPSLILKGFWFWDQDARILPCTMFRGPSAGPGRSVVSANKLDREVKGHGKFERPGSFRRVFKSWQRVFVRYDINFWDSCIKRWQFSTSTLHHPKFECATPKFPWLSSPSLILKGFWFWDQDARILPSTLFSTMFRSPSAVPGRSVVSANNGGWKNWIEAGWQGSFGRVFNTWQRVFVRFDIYDLLYIHHHLEVQFWIWCQNARLPSHEFEKAMQQCWTRRRVKRVLVCRTTHHERSGCILVQMLSFPSPCIYAMRDETWHIRTWTLHHRGKYSLLKKPGERDKNVGQTKAYMGAFLGISTFYMKSRRGPCPHLPPSMWTHTDLFMDLMIFKLLGLPAQVGDVATFLFHANHWNCSRYWPRIFWMALTLIAKPVLPVLQLLAVLLQRPI